MIYGSLEKGFIELLHEIELENERRKKYPSLPKINIVSLRRRTALYFAEREKGEKLRIEKEQELGRKLTAAEYKEIDMPITVMGRSLKDDLMFGSSGFEDKSQVFSVANEYNKMVDEATGIIPPEYEELLERMKTLSKGERFRLIEGLHEREEISWVEKDSLIEFFINYDEELEKDQNNKFEMEIDMSEINISPSHCPFRACNSVNGKQLCMFVDKENEENIDEDEFTEQKTVEEYRDDNTDDSHDYNSGDEDNDDSDSDSDSYSFSLDGAELDMDYGADYDADFGDFSASLDFDGDSGDSGDSGD
jgi:hypothetical protein